MYVRKSFLKGSHHRCFHRNIFAITWFERMKAMHHWATTGNFRSFLLIGNFYHKRDIFLLETLENGVQQFLRAVFNSTNWLPKRTLIGYGTPWRPGEICFIHQIEYDFWYLINLNSSKSKSIFVCTTFLLYAISLLFWFDFKSISVAILFLFYSNTIFKWIDLEFHKDKNILMAVARQAPWMSIQWSFLLKSAKHSPDNLCSVFFGKIKVQAVLLQILFTNCFIITRFRIRIW